MQTFKLSILLGLVSSALGLAAGDPYNHNTAYGECDVWSPTATYVDDGCCIISGRPGYERLKVLCDHNHRCAAQNHACSHAPGAEFALCDI
ncbi:unnamed protein product [Zymoseptoria tritici ST99CH_1A5]|uniref:Uncharacterized protein n=3 Tax=Zymoseptoria tritici TaxID=1047171 RepID=A0A1X7RG97_ZYMT9|nr:unnamed protein product [Zymoseptoria tritici ST99CH_3D7]SMR42804.1 unnamed protein product [Zymoseptoria tritici ST99CH_1E4]SMR44976.1 unnamed protein product [Zymoseptoria tritici ST99CH_3D1]SMY20140.1 unnamed protein product [Zymoseptoria tritici ST99CH_1A5]